MRIQQAAPLLEDRAAAPGELRRIGWETWSGMFISNLVAYVVILTTALTLHGAGIVNVQTAAEAAMALRPLAGDLAYYLFALGIVGVGMLAVPVLAGAGAYALAETLGWEWGLEVEARHAARFYSVIAVSVLAGVALGFTSLSPMKALFYSAVLNGVVAVPLLVLILLLAMRSSVLKDYRVRGWLLWLGWLTTAVMALCAGAMLLPSN